MEITKKSHCLYHCRYHIVIATKYRREIFNEGVYKFFKSRLEEVKKYYTEIRIIEVNSDKDHVHMLVSIPPTMSVGSVVRIIKCNLSRDLKKEFKFLKKVYYDFVSTAGVSEAQIKKYIEMQGEEDLGQTTELFETD